MESWLVWLLFGHLFGDYFLQNSWMAFNKKDPDKIWPCIAHCSIYTVVVYTFIRIGAGIALPIDIVFWIFVSHWVFDRYRIVEWWLKVYGVRSWDTYIGNDPSAHSTITQIVHTSFGAIVYVVIDNTLHLFCMFLIMNNIVLIENQWVRTALVSIPIIITAALSIMLALGAAYLLVMTLFCFIEDIFSPKWLCKIGFHIPCSPSSIITECEKCGATLIKGESGLHTAK